MSTTAIKTPNRIVTTVIPLEPGGADGWAVHWSNQVPRRRSPTGR